MEFQTINSLVTVEKVVANNQFNEPNLASLQREENRTTLDINGKAVTVESTTEFKVTNTKDSGEGSLRQAILDANEASGNDLITFDDSLSGETITLSSGELRITDALTITGLGKDELTIDAEGNSRVFNINDNTENGIAISISDLTITGGNTTDQGGGILNEENLTLRDSRILGNSASEGGGIGDNSFGGMRLLNTTISDNSASEGGGISNDGFLNLANSTVSGNSAELGAGIYQDFGSVTLTNSTVSGNSSSGNGGGIANSRPSTVTLTNSTISGNSALENGGGIYSNGVLYLSNSIIANSPSGGDVYNSGVTDTRGVNLVEDGSVDNVLTGDPNLSPLQDNGGAIQTHALLPESPAIDVGDNRVLASDETDLDQDGNFQEPLPLDQRGVFGANRVSNGVVDLGAFEFTESPILATNDFERTLENTSLSLDVLLNDAPDSTLVSFDETTEQGGTVSLENNGADEQLLYTPPNDFIGEDEFSYTISQGEETDRAVATIFVTSETLVVDTLVDEKDGDLSQGDVSLREALEFVSPGGTIEVASALDGESIVLDSQLPELVIDKAVTVRMQGDAEVTIDAGENNQVFEINDKTTKVIDVALEGLTITGANSNGGIVNQENLTISNSTIAGNTAKAISNDGVRVGGGLVNTETLTVRNSTISGNSANGGSGIFNSGTLNVYNTTISENFIEPSIFPFARSIVFNSRGTANLTNTNISDNSGGAIYNSLATFTIKDSSVSNNDGTGITNRGTLTVTTSTLSGNSSSNRGGGIDNEGSLTLTNSTISGNSATEGGGLFNHRSYSEETPSTATLSNVTVFDNSANDGGGIKNEGDLTLTNSIIANSINGEDFAGNDPTLTGNNLVGDGSVEGVITGDPNLTLLQDHGGATLTHAILPDSPVIDAGDNNTLPSDEFDRDGDENTEEAIPFDQRGEGFDRLVNNTVDLGAVEKVDLDAPINQRPIVEEAVSTLDVNAITEGTVVGNVVASDPDGDSLTFALGEGNSDIDEDGNTAFAIDQAGKITVTDPDDIEFETDSSFELVVEVSDGDLTVPTSVKIQPSFTFTVTNADDSGEGSLRQTLSQANRSPGQDTILFDANLEGETITLSSGELEITDAVAIEGLGADQLTIDGNSSSRVFSIDDGDSSNQSEVKIKGIEIIGGVAKEESSEFSNRFNDEGGGILNFENLTLSNSQVLDSLGDSGGGVSNRGVLSLINSTIAENAATRSGGGIFNDRNGTVTLTNSTISGNAAGDNRESGGGIHNSGSLSVTNSTILGNSVPTTDRFSRAGGIKNDGSVTVINSIIANNQGGDFAGDDPTLTGNNLVEDGSVEGVITGNPNLTVLQDNGGATLTHAILPDSPVIDAGDNNTVPSDEFDRDGDENTEEAIPFDQRGEGFDRVVNDTVDLGAVEKVDLDAPINQRPIVEEEVFTLPVRAITEGTVVGNVAASDPDGDALSFTLTGENPDLDEDGENAFAIDQEGTITVTDPNDIDFETNASLDLGVEVSDGNFTVPTSFKVVPGFTFTVTNTDDSGEGSLRDAINQANEASGQDIITFDANLEGETITLTSGDLEITDGVKIEGLGADQLTIDGNGNSRVLLIDDGELSQQSEVDIKGIKIVGGVTNEEFSEFSNRFNDEGGGILNLENLTLSKSKVLNNSGNSGGGVSNRGLLTLINSTIAENAANTDFVSNGGGIRNDGGTLRLINTTISGNTAAESAGGILNRNGTVTLTNSTISGNSVTGHYRTSGGIYNSGSLSLTNSTIFGNSALASSYGSRGGGIENNGSVTLTNSIIANNKGGDFEGNEPTLTGNNLIADGSVEEVLTGDPNLTPLQDNGGFTLTHGILPDSPVIDAGNNNSLPKDEFDLDGDNQTEEVISYDQRGEGFDRVINDTVDLGAVEGEITGDAPPLIETISPITLPENPATGTVILESVTVTDADSSPEEITFSFEFGNEQGWFAIDENSGEITVTETGASNLDFESLKNISLGVRATDEQNNRALEQVSIQLENVNEAPTISETQFEVNQAANLSSGNLIGSVTANDPDSGDVLRQFAIAEGNDPDQNGENAFTIDAVTGQLSVAAPEELESEQTFTLTIAVTDAEGATGTTDIEVEVVDNSDRVLTVDTITDEDDGDASVGSGLSLRDAISIANESPKIPYTILLTGGETYTLGETDSSLRDLAIATESNLAIRAVGDEPATIETNATESRIFDIASDATVTLENLVITEGTQFSGSGIRNAGFLSLTDTEILKNFSDDSEGSSGESIFNSGVLTVTESVVSDNNQGFVNEGNLLINQSTISGNNGNGILNAAYDEDEIGSLVVSNSTISNNGNRGITNEGTLAITASTLSGNSSSNRGGGIRNSGSLTLTNSTISGNSATEGGGLFNEPNYSEERASTATLTNVTVSDNTANEGGGIKNYTDLSLTNSIVANSINGEDFAGNTPTLTGNNLVEDGSISDVITGDPKLTPLQDNGGSTLTHAILPESPVIDAGDNNTLPSDEFDQRGEGFDRVVNDTVDLGAVEKVDINAPINQRPIIEETVFSLQVSAITEGTVVGNVAASDRDGDALSFTLTEENPDLDEDGESAFAIDQEGTITVTDPDDIDFETNASFDLEVEVSDGNFTVPASVEILPGFTFTVTNADDSGEGSLRDAINQANEASGQDIITFDANLEGETITLSSGALAITNDVEIEGLEELTIDAAGNSEVFRINNNQATAIDVTIENLIVSGGNNRNGGGIFNTENLNLNNSVVTGNFAEVDGGGILNEEGTLTLNQSTVSGNTADDDGGGINNLYGTVRLNQSIVAGNSAANFIGGINNFQGTLELNQITVSSNTAEEDGGGIGNLYGTLNLTDSTISGNSANDDSGGIVNYYGTSNLINSTISGNSSEEAGGGIGNRYGTINLTNSTVSGNSAAEIGGGIYNNSDSSLSLTNSTIFANSVTDSNSSFIGGGIDNNGSVTLTNSIIANNQAEDFDGNEPTLTGNNLIADGSVEEVITGDPKLTPLQDNGGFTFTHLPLENSPVIDAGDNNTLPSDEFDRDEDENTEEAIPYDQRGEGFDRVVNETVDLGAIEVQNTVDLIFGSTTDDILDSANPNQDFDGNNDLTFTGAGVDLVDVSTSSTGNNRIYGGTDNDEILLGKDDRAFGLQGDDILDASQGMGNNRLYGGEGNDDLLLGNNDHAIAGNGNDRLFVTMGGNNLLTGSTGDDQFWLANAEVPETPNTITDFTAEEDILGIGGFPEITFEELSLTQEEENAVIGLDENTPLAELQGVEANILTAEDFIFSAESSI